MIGGIALALGLHLAQSPDIHQKGKQLMRFGRECFGASRPLRIVFQELRIMHPHHAAAGARRHDHIVIGLKRRDHVARFRLGTARRDVAISCGLRLY